MKDIFLIWIQWSWKWTQANLIMNKYWNFFSYFETWWILRAIKSTDNALAKYINKTINDWNLVWWDFVAWLFEAYIYSLDYWKFMLVDSVARNLQQMKAVINKMSLRNQEYCVLYFDLPYEIAIQRISNRRICSKCQKVYNIWLDLSLIKCNCGWELVIRHDDKKEIISQRIKLFYDETLPVIEYFENLWKIIKIDASWNPQEVFELIEKSILN